MSAMAAIENVVAPFTRGAGVAKDGRLHLPPHTLELVRASLPEAETWADEIAGEWLARLAEVRAAPKPFLAAMAARAAIRIIEEQERQLGRLYQNLLVKERDLFGGESAALLGALNGINLRILEALRDTRAQFIELMAKSAPRRPEGGPRSVAAIRQAILGR